MGVSYDEARYDEAMAAMYEEALQDRERLLQCIYLFVEGECELLALPGLLEKSGLHLGDLGIEVVEIGGAGNAKHAVRVLRKTISWNRPLVLLLDMDTAGLEASRSSVIAQDRMTHVAFLPSSPQVEYPSTLRGGEFEDCFDPSTLVEACLQTLAAEERAAVDADLLLAAIDPANPRLLQVNRWLRDHLPSFQEVRKLDLARALADSGEVPGSVADLSVLLQEVRANYPLVDHYEAVDEHMKENL